MKKGISVEGVYSRAREFVVMLVISALAYLIISLIR
jgi:hypothetical protein